MASCLKQSEKNNQTGSKNARGDSIIKMRRRNGTSMATSALNALIFHTEPSTFKALWRLVYLIHNTLEGPGNARLGCEGAFYMVS